MIKNFTRIASRLFLLCASFAVSAYAQFSPQRCPTGQFVIAFNNDGSVVCEAGAGGGITPPVGDIGGTTGAPTVVGLETLPLPTLAATTGFFFDNNGTLALKTGVLPVAGTAGQPEVSASSTSIVSSPLYLDASQLGGISGCSNLSAFAGACDTRALFGSQSLSPITIGNGTVPTTFQFPDYCVWGMTGTSGAVGYTLNNLTNVFSNASDLRCELTNNSAANGLSEMVLMSGTYSKWKGPTVYNSNSATTLSSGFGVVIDGPNDGSSFEGSVLNYAGGGIEIKNNFCCWSTVKTVINGDYTGSGPGLEVLGNASGDPNGWFVEGSIGHQTGLGNSEVLVIDTSSGHLTWGAFGRGYTEHYNPGTSPMSFSGSLNVAVKDWEFKYTTGGETDPLITIANVATPSINIQDLACTVGCSAITAAISDSVAADSLSPPLLIPLNANGTVPNYWNGVNYITHLITPINMETGYQMTFDETSTAGVAAVNKTVCTSNTTEILCSFNNGAAVPFAISGGGALGYSGAPTVSSTVYVPVNGGGNGSATAANVGWPVTAAAPVSGLQVYSSAVPGTGNTLVVTLCDVTISSTCGTLQAVTCTITAAANSCSDTTHTFTPSIGDLLVWQIAPTGTVTITPNILVGANFATPQLPALANMWIGGWGSGTPSGNQYGYLLGKQSVLTGTAATAQFVMPRAMTFTGIQVNMSAAEGAAATLAVSVGVCTPNSSGACTPSASSLTCTVGNSVAKCNSTGVVTANQGDLAVLMTTQTGTGTTAVGDVSVLYQ